MEVIISNGCSDAGKGCGGIEQDEVEGVQENARKRKQGRALGRESKEERKAACKQKRVDTRFFRPKR